MNKAEIGHKIMSPFLLLGVFFLDRLTKNYAMDNFIHPVRVGGVANLAYTENSGISFGLFQGNNLFFIAFTAVLIILIIVFRRKISGEKPRVHAALALILGGALGNLYDRIVHGYVIDFIDLKFFPAVFNAADSFITIGAFMILLDQILEER